MAGVEHGLPLVRLEYERLGVMPFQDFPIEKQSDINDQCMEPRAPYRWLEGDGFRMTSRAWFEWFIRRGRDPRLRLRREKIPAWLRVEVIARDGMVCQLCWAAVLSPKDIHIDHIRPVSRGGRAAFSNLRVTHAVCNLARGNRWDGSP